MKVFGGKKFKNREILEKSEVWPSENYFWMAV